MTDSKKSDQKVFTSMAQLEAELFPNKSFVLDEDTSEEEVIAEADVLAKKLMSDLLGQVKKQGS